MTYLRRALKYFIQVTILFALIIGILMLVGMVPKDVDIAFREGWRSIAFILGIFAVMGIVYPFFGYTKRTIRAKGDPADNWPLIEQAMEIRGYRKGPNKDDGARRFVLRSGFNRMARLWEDTITITPTIDGFQAEGLSRDLARVVMAIDHKINQYD